MSLKKRSLRDWHPKKWFQGQPVKMCRCKSFLLVVSKAVSCSCPLGRTKISKSFRNSILTWYMLYLYEWRPKMQKKWFLGKSMPHYHNSKSQIPNHKQRVFYNIWHGHEQLTALETTKRKELHRHILTGCPWNHFGCQSLKERFFRDTLYQFQTLAHRENIIHIYVRSKT